MIDFNIIEKNYIEHNEKRVNEGYFLGSICGIWNKEKKLWGCTAGSSKVDRSKGIKDDSLFRLASMTKPITAVAFMQLYEKGLVDLDAPISKFIPEFKSMKVMTKIENGRIIETEDAQRQITPRMILSHSSGIGSGVSGVHQSAYIKKQPTLEETANEYAKAVLEFQPGTKQAYSATWAFDILARVIEVVSGQDFASYLKENITSPLGMKDTTFHPNDEQVLREVEFCIRTDEGILPREMNPKVGFGNLREGWVCGGAGLFSTLDDYSKFARMLLRGGEYNSTRILKKSTIDLMKLNQTVETPDGKLETMWGLSFFVRRENDFLPNGTFGWSGAYGAHFWVDTERDITCIYMSNLANASGAGEPAVHEFEHDVMLGVS